MTTSDSIKEISKALMMFHSLVNAVEKKETNPFFKSKYADLSAVLESIKAPLSDSGLTFVQFPDGDGLTTRIIHAESAEWMEAQFPMIYAKQDPQGQGSAITYTRRYALKSILGLTEEDDDGNAASGKGKQNEPAPDDTEDLRCKQCGAVAKERSGKTEQGRPFKGIFCTEKRQHVEWLKT
jgi:hypothetical protein